jgi:L-serine/L-threonine ammonia-lyase
LCPQLESSQPSGSFKTRGVGHLAAKAAKDVARSTSKPARSSPSKKKSRTTTGSTSRMHFVSSSGGNAGLAAAYSASVLGGKCTVFVPASTTFGMKGRLETFGADVIMAGAAWDDADLKARAFVETGIIDGVEGNTEEYVWQPEQNACFPILSALTAVFFTTFLRKRIYVPPFDHDDIVEGNATLVHELHTQWQQKQDKRRPPDAIICAVGGGGLLAGVLKGLDDVGWDQGLFSSPPIWIKNPADNFVLQSPCLEPKRPAPSRWRYRSRLHTATVIADFRKCISSHCPQSLQWRQH